MTNSSAWNVKPTRSRLGNVNTKGLQIEVFAEGLYQLAVCDGVDDNSS